MKLWIAASFALAVAGGALYLISAVSWGVGFVMILPFAVTMFLRANSNVEWEGGIFGDRPH